MAAQRERAGAGEADDAGADDEDVHQTRLVIPDAAQRRSGISSGLALRRRKIPDRRFAPSGMTCRRHAAIDICGAAAFTSASTWASKRLKFASNIATRRFAVSAKAALSCQVLTG